LRRAVEVKEEVEKQNKHIKPIKYKGKKNQNNKTANKHFKKLIQKR